MNCTRCGGKTFVSDRRERMRRRMCEACGHRFKTMEYPETEILEMAAEINAARAVLKAVKKLDALANRQEFWPEIQGANITIIPNDTLEPPDENQGDQKTDG